MDSPEPTGCSQQLVDPKLSLNKLMVNETFYSVQGEGRWLGTPALFVRLQYCNLGCPNCDTQTTWHRDFVSERQKLAPDEVARNLLALAPDELGLRPRLHVVITGGEPLLQQQPLVSLIDELRIRGLRFFELETNGTILPGPELLSRIDWWNCSPKLSFTGVSERRRINADAISALVSSENVDFKFVVREAGDVTELEQTFGPLIPPDRIWLMPCGANREEQGLRQETIIDLCLNRGYRFTPRLQTLIWNNQRGR